MSKCFETNGHQEYFCLNQVGCPKRYCCGYRKLLLIISKTACALQFSSKSKLCSVIKSKIDEKPNKSESQNMNRKNDSFLVKIMKIKKKIGAILSRRYLAIKQRRKLRNLSRTADGWKSKGKLKYYALSFYRSQNVLGWSKVFVPDQKFIYILWQSQTFCARQKDDLHSVKLVFVPAQKFLKRH